MLIFSLAIALRLVPEILAYPHPIGYDVVNYYIPVVTYLPENWESVVDDFPLYSLFLYSISTITGLSAQSTVAGTAIAAFGLFALSVYFASKKLFSLTEWESVFVASFVVVQIAVLRTTWDLHRDVLALSMMLIVFGFVSKKNSLFALVILAAVCCLTLAADRMVGLLLSITLIAGAIVRKNRDLMVLATISIILFVSLLLPPLMIPNEVNSGSGSSLQAPQTSVLDYFVLFAVLNGTVAVPAIFGLNKSRNLLLAVPFIISGIGALSWLALTDSAFLVPERWTILFGIFASVFAGYFIVDTLRRYRKRIVISAAILATFAVIGLAYALLPYDRPFVLLSAAKPYVEDFMPVTMQFNALDVDDNDELLFTINVINQHTEPDAVIVGAKHWRGFMQLHLTGERIYLFSDNPEALGRAQAHIGRNAYLLEPSENSSSFEFTKIEDSVRR